MGRFFRDLYQILGCLLFLIGIGVAVFLAGLVWLAGWVWARL